MFLALQSCEAFQGQRLDIVPQHPSKHNILLILRHLDSGEKVKKGGQVLQFDVCRSLQPVG